MKKIALLVIAFFFSSSVAMAEGTTGVGALTGALVGGLAGSQLGGGTNGHFLAGVTGAAIGAVIGEEIEGKARTPKDPVSHHCRSGFRPVEIVSTTMPDPRACLLNEQFESAFVDWSCPGTHPLHALGAGNKPLCLNPSTFVEADTIRQNNGYAVKDRQEWWPCALGTGQVWEKHPDGSLTPGCRAGYAQQPQPQGGGTFQNANYARGYARAMERREYERERADEQAGYSAGMGKSSQYRTSPAGLFGGRVATFQ